MQKTFRLVTIGSILLFVTCLCYSVYCNVIHHAVRDQLVDEWLDIAIERRRLAGLDSVTVLITPEQYETELAVLSEREQRIVFHTEFPNDKNALREFLLSRVTGNYYSSGFWLLMLVSVAGISAGVSWLHGHAAGVGISNTSNITSENDPNT